MKTIAHQGCVCLCVCRVQLFSLLIFPQVLIATSTLAWGVNFPAHLVVVKGTEYFDGKSRRYVDYPITGWRPRP